MCLPHQQICKVRFYEWLIVEEAYMLGAKWNRKNAKTKTSLAQKELGYYVIDTKFPPSFSGD
jgi:hypothetical protein